MFGRELGNRVRRRPVQLVECGLDGLALGERATGLDGAGLGDGRAVDADRVEVVGVVYPGVGGLLTHRREVIEVGIVTGLSLFHHRADVLRRFGRIGLGELLELRELPAGATPATPRGVGSPLHDPQLIAVRTADDREHTRTEGGVTFTRSVRQTEVAPGRDADMEYHVDGDLVAREDATVSVEDRGFRYGDAAFETCRAYGGEVFAWSDHRDRLAATCETLGMAEAVPADLTERVAETLAANDLADAYVRVSVTRGVQSGKLTPKPATDPTVVVVVKPLPRGGLAGERVWDDPATVQTVTTRRVPSNAVPADAKTHNYLNGIMARLELRRATTEDHQPDEALVRDQAGRVQEGTTSNLFFVSDGVLKTPERGELLPGITREHVLDIARGESFPVETGEYDLDDVREADEAFLTNSTWELRPVESVDGIAIGTGPITTLCQRLYDERVDVRCY